MKYHLVLNFPENIITLSFEDTEADYAPYGYKSTPYKSAKSQIDDKLKEISQNGGMWQGDEWLPYHTLKSAKIVEIE